MCKVRQDQTVENNLIHSSLSSRECEAIHQRRMDDDLVPFNRPDLVAFKRGGSSTQWC